MLTNNGSGYIFAFASRILRCCLVVVAIGQISHSINPAPIVEGVTPVQESGCSPVWMSETQSLYFVDMVSKTINKYKPAGKGEFVSANLDEPGMVAFVVPISASKFVASFVTVIGVFTWDGKTTGTIMNAYSLSNVLSVGEAVICGKGDYSGRLWFGISYVEAGSHEPNRGRLYSVNANGTAIIKLENIGVPTGISWNAASDRLYYVDNLNYQIIGHTFKNGPGDIVNDGEVVFDFKGKNITCGPYDMTVDANGNLWVACTDSNHIVKIDIKTKAVVLQVDFPEATSMKSVAFGGTTFEDLYVTGDKCAMFRVTKTGSKGISSKAVNVGPPPEEDENSGGSTNGG